MCPQYLVAVVNPARKFPRRTSNTLQPVAAFVDVIFAVDISYSNSLSVDGFTNQTTFWMAGHCCG